MTKEEAIDILQEDIAINKHLIDTLPSTAAETFKNDILAYNMAIKSLEAWEIIRNNIKEERVKTNYREEIDTYNKVLSIIDKHLSEVSE